eukprot:gene9354-8396_t
MMDEGPPHPLCPRVYPHKRPLNPHYLIPDWMKPEPHPLKPAGVIVSAEQQLAELPQADRQKLD